jgi:hypothetical protein
VDLYRDFKVAQESIPYILIHVKSPPNLYDLKVHADLRKFFFKPHMEDTVFEQIRAFLWDKFNRM